VAFDSIPQARVVRKAGRLLTPPPPPRSTEAGPLQLALGYAVGMWPLTCVVMLVLGLLILAGNNGAP
jgi:hypothetical protein